MSPERTNSTSSCPWRTRLQGGATTTTDGGNLLLWAAHVALALGVAFPFLRHAIRKKAGSSAVRKSWMQLLFSRRER